MTYASQQTDNLDLSTDAISEGDEVVRESMHNVSGCAVAIGQSRYGALVEQVLSASY